MNKVLLCLASILTAVSTSDASGSGGADLQVRLALSLARARDTFGFEAIVKNAGPYDARNVQLSILMPKGAEVRNAEECDFNKEAALARCNIGALSAGDVRRVFFLMLSEERDPRVAVIAISDTFDLDRTNNFDTNAPSRRRPESDW